MADPFAAALAALHASVGAAAAVYDPEGDAIPLRVIRNQGSRDVAYGSGTIRMEADLVSIRRADVARPAIGDELEIAGDDYRLSAEPKLDAEGLSWVCEVEPA